MMVARGSGEWQIDPLKCSTCNLCVEVCPVKFLSMKIENAPSLIERTAGTYKVKALDEEGHSPLE